MRKFAYLLLANLAVSHAFIRPWASALDVSEVGEASRVEENEVFDAEDYNVDDDGSEAPSAGDLAKDQQKRKRDTYDDDDESGDDEQVLIDLDEPEATGTAAEKEAEPTVAGAAEDDLDLLEDEEDLQEREEGVKAGDQPQPSESNQTNDADGTQSSSRSKSPMLYDGQAVVTTDEEGVELDTSLLNPQEEDSTPSITEFVEKVPTFKKEKEEKEKRKLQEKKQREANNNIDVYEREIQDFREIQAKNENRFSEGIENAEEGLQPPPDPGMWRRFQHWYGQKLDRLVDRFGSDLKD